MGYNPAIEDESLNSFIHMDSALVIITILLLYFRKYLFIQIFYREIMGHWYLRNIMDEIGLQFGKENACAALKKATRAFLEEG